MDRAKARRLLRWEPATWRQAFVSAVVEVLLFGLFWVWSREVFGPDIALSRGWAAIFAVSWVVLSLLRFWVTRRRRINGEGRRSPTARG